MFIQGSVEEITTTVARPQEVKEKVQFDTYKQNKFDKMEHIIIKKKMFNTHKQRWALLAQTM